MAVVERLLEAGCSRLARDAHGNQPWHAAAEAAQLEVMRLLQARGCTWELRNNSGWTALHFAAHAGACVPLAAGPAGGSAQHIAAGWLKVPSCTAHEAQG